MKSKNYFLSIAILCIIITIPISAKAEDYDKVIYHAYVNNNSSDWESVLKELENQSLSTIDKKLQLVGYYYGFVGYLISKNKYNQAKKYIEKGNILIDEVLQESPENVTAYAYKGSFLSFSMAINKIKSLVLASKSMKYINKAYELDPENIQAITDKGNLTAYAPNFAGGDKKEAVKYYEQAISLLEKEKKTDENWFYLNLMVTLAQTYSDINENEKAEKLYLKILKKEPRLVWIKKDSHLRITPSLEN